jgi:hypothetical protein
MKVAGFQFNQNDSNLTRFFAANPNIISYSYFFQNGPFGFSDTGLTSTSRRPIFMRVSNWPNMDFM